MPPASAEAQCWQAALANIKDALYNPLPGTKISKSWREIFTMPSGCQNFTPELPPSSMLPPVTRAPPRLSVRHCGPLHDAASSLMLPPLTCVPPSTTTPSPPPVVSPSPPPPSQSTAAGHPSTSSSLEAPSWPPPRCRLLLDAAAAHPCTAKLLECRCGHLPDATSSSMLPPLTRAPLSATTPPPPPAVPPSDPWVRLFLSTAGPPPAYELGLQAPPLRSSPTLPATSMTPTAAAPALLPNARRHHASLLPTAP
ncbi:proline-rich receptor-like protein kinase PERK2 [Setaria italica]|uniref:proline-rich receptor-like protein kinase PERK2 n=1 Tax=Setaria italica TaxID=4555 RepID=UPI000350D672|nr:proline-rich receptor-like protein kinase PERK2 [Setaria italica]